MEESKSSTGEITIEETRKILFPTKEINFPVLLDQYKLLIDNTHKITERLEASNNLFITSNSFIFSSISFFIKEFTLKIDSQGGLLVCVLLTIGLILSFSWMRVINAYKKSSAINYIITQAIEEKLNSPVFWFKFQTESKKTKKRRSNILVYMEAYIPRLFIAAYLVCACVIIFTFK